MEIIIIIIPFTNGKKTNPELTLWTQGMLLCIKKSDSYKKRNTTNKI